MHAGVGAHSYTAPMTSRECVRRAQGPWTCRVGGALSTAATRHEHMSRPRRAHVYPNGALSSLKEDSRQHAFPRGKKVWAFLRLASTACMAMHRGEKRAAHVRPAGEPPDNSGCKAMQAVGWDG